MDKKKLMKFIKIITLILSVIVIVLVYYELKFFDVIIGIYQLESKNKKIVRVSKKSLIYIMRSKEKEELFIREMDLLDWKFYDTYGRGYLFTKNGEEILATQSKRFGRYTVYEIHNEKYFDYMNREL
jgi:cell division protein YceG involved in septum cleavage